MLLKKYGKQPGMVVPAFSSITGSEGRDKLISRPAWSTEKEFQASQDYTGKPCLNPPTHNRNVYDKSQQQIKEEDNQQAMSVGRKLYHTGCGL